MNLFSNNRRTVNVKLIIIGALMAPMSVISTSVFSSEKISDKKNHLCFADNSNTIQVCETVPLGFNTNLLTNSYSSHNVLDSKEPTSTINNYIQQPENSTDIGSYIISILALLVSAGVPLWQRYVQIRDSKNQKLDSINEGFWIREVVMPQINLNIFNLCTAFRNKLNLSQPEFTIVYRDELLPLLNELRDSFSLFKAFPNASNAILTLQQYCDDFDDSITDHIDEPINVRKADISTFQLTLTKELIKTHMLIS
ncbi:hypothetical protein ABEL08_17280 [Escherichia coli]